MAHIENIPPPGPRPAFALPVLAPAPLRLPLPRLPVPPLTRPIIRVEEDTNIILTRLQRFWGVDRQDDWYGAAIRRLRESLGMEGSDDGMSALDDLYDG